MNAKAFLQQIKKLDTLIENKLIEKSQWWAMATSTTGKTDGERVSGSGNPDKMADAIMRYVGIEKEIDEYIDRLVDTKKEVIHVIEQLNTTEYDLLHKVYVQGIPLYDVAIQYDRTYSWCTTVHGRALKNVQKILDNERR